MKTIAAFFAASLLLASQASAADMALKAAPPPAAPNWTGFYVGGEVGGAWGNRAENYTGNDPAAVGQLTASVVPLVGEQAVFPNTLGMSGVTGGIEAGYNWQIDRKWLLGLEADFNGSNLRGNGNSTSNLQGPPAAVFTQTVATQQNIDWYGTLRGRIGWLPTSSLLLFGTGGFAYGQVANTGTYSNNGPAVGTNSLDIGGFSFVCTTNGSACFAGASSQVRTGYTLGGGAEWLVSRSWSLKVEYQYVNLGSAPLRLTATAVVAPGETPSSFNANFGRDDFHVVRVGANYHF